eukprot:4629027-Prorocentrum_lima.AAC.1
MPWGDPWYKSPGMDKLRDISLRAQASPRGVNIPVFVHPRQGDLLWVLNQLQPDPRWTLYDLT